MPRPGGNPGNKGNTTKGPRKGRSSAYQEQADAKELFEMFFGEHSVEEIQAKIATKKYSIKTLMLLKAMGGNERFVSDMFKKVFPDNVNLQGQIHSEELQQIAEDIRSYATTIKTKYKKR